MKAHNFLDIKKMTFLRSPINLDFAQKCHFTQYKIKIQQN